MTHPDLNSLTATEALADLKAARYGATELVRACLIRIEANNPVLNALVAHYPEEAMAQARERDLKFRQGQPEGPLAGLPISIKDAFATRGRTTTSGFRPLANYRPPHDATIVRRLSAAGSIMMGKSHLSELAGAPHGFSRFLGHCLNPWDTTRTTGGSSSGAAAAIAAGFSLLEAGSDLGGSIRIPAAYCGVAGLKATECRIPMTGHIPPLPAQFGGHGRSVWHMLSMGVLARSVADLDLGFRLLAGPDGEDSSVPPYEQAPALTSLLKNTPEKLRVALWNPFSEFLHEFPLGHAPNLPLCERTQEGLNRMVLTLRRAGHTVVEIPSLPGFDLLDTWKTFGVIAGCELGMEFPYWLRQMSRILEALLPKSYHIEKYMAAGLGSGQRAYNHALNQREALIAALEDYLGQWDLLLCPVAPMAAYPLTDIPRSFPLSRISVGSQKRPYFTAAVPMVIPFSLTGSPVVVLPTGSIKGLPIGIQAVGRRWQEHTLLARCVRIEASLGGFRAPQTL